MAIDTLGAGTQLGASRTAAGKSAEKPNYILLVIGLALVLVQIFMVSGRVPSPVANAALLALGLTLGLYGVFPVSIMRGKFTGLLGTLVLTGPAALGVFLFAYTLHSLNGEAKRLTQANDRVDDVVLLTASTIDRRHNSRTIGDTTIKLLDVDSFSDERITEVVDRLDNTLESSGIADKKARRQEVRRLLASVIPHLRLGESHQAKALAVLDAYLEGQPGANPAWEAAIAEAAADAKRPEQLVNRVKRLPFAVMKVTEKSKPRFLAMSESGQLSVGSRTYGIPVIANPAKRSVPNLEEAVVLTAAAG